MNDGVQLLECVQELEHCEHEAETERDQRCDQTCILDVHIRSEGGVITPTGTIACANVVVAVI